MKVWMFFWGTMGMLSLAVFGADISPFTEMRMDKLYEEFDVTALDEEIYFTRNANVLLLLHPEVVGDYRAKHSQRAGVPISDGVIVDELIYSNVEEKEKWVSVKITHALSAKDARFALFYDMESASAPIRLIIANYEVYAEGPGDLCIVRKDKEYRDEVCFTRGNIAVGVHSRSPGISAMELARQVEELLVDAEAISIGSVVVETNSAPSSAEALVQPVGFVVESPDVVPSNTVIALQDSPVPPSDGLESDTRSPNLILWLFLLCVGGVVVIGWCNIRKK